MNKKGADQTDLRTHKIQHATLLAFCLLGQRLIQYFSVIIISRTHEDFPNTFEPRYDKMCLEECPTRQDTN